MDNSNDPNSINNPNPVPSFGTPPQPASDQNNITSPASFPPSDPLQSFPTSPPPSSAIPPFEAQPSIPTTPTPSTPPPTPSSWPSTPVQQPQQPADIWPSLNSTFPNNSSSLESTPAWNPPSQPAPTQAPPEPAPASPDIWPANHQPTTDASSLWNQAPPTPQLPPEPFPSTPAPEATPPISPPPVSPIPDANSSILTNGMATNQESAFSSNTGAPSFQSAETPLSPLDNPWGSPSQPPPIDQPQSSTIQPSWMDNKPASTETLPASPLTSSEAAPTDLSHLITNNSESAAPSPATENLVVPTVTSATPEVPTSSARHHGGIPSWLIGLGIMLLVLVGGASAYFILGIGQPSKTTTSIPATVSNNTVTKTSTPAASPINQPTTQPAASGSANFGELDGSNNSGTQATSAAALLRQRQQGR